jgi:hypothetical protein
MRECRSLHRYLNRHSRVGVATWHPWYSCSGLRRVSVRVLWVPRCYSVVIRGVRRVGGSARRKRIVRRRSGRSVAGSKASGHLPVWARESSGITRRRVRRRRRQPPGGLSCGTPCRGSRRRLQARKRQPREQPPSGGHVRHQSHFACRAHPAASALATRNLELRRCRVRTFAVACAKRGNASGCKGVCSEPAAAAASTATAAVRMLVEALAAEVLAL